MKIINKIAFLVHEPVMYAHYSSVWAKMNRDYFVIVLLGSFASDSGDVPLGVNDFLNKIQTLGYTFVYLDKIVSERVKYQYVISNHVMGGNSVYPVTQLWPIRHKIQHKVKMFINTVRSAVGIPNKSSVTRIDPVQYIPLQAGIKQIRFMYGADISDGWSLDMWNEIYDLFLCHGPNDEVQIKKRFRGKTAIMGYPRYDDYFSPKLSIDDIATEFGIDPDKKTILWMPTVDAFGDNACSIPYFAEALAKFKDDFNIIVRPHPISFRLDPTGIKLLESLGYKIDRDALRDMNKPYLLADTILCDHGGSAFGALYLGKKLVFLKTPSPDTATVLKASSNLELMKSFPIIAIEDIASLGNLINDTDYWQERLEYTRTLADKYFANYRGDSSQKVSDILGRLNNLIK